MSRGVKKKAQEKHRFISVVLTFVHRFKGNGRGLHEYTPDDSASASPRQNARFLRMTTRTFPVVCVCVAGGNARETQPFKMRRLRGKCVPECDVVNHSITLALCNVVLSKMTEFSNSRTCVKPNNDLGTDRPPPPPLRLNPRSLACTKHRRHHTHCALAVFAHCDAREWYETLRRVYNTARPQRCPPAPPFDEWDMTAVCDHIFCV